MDNNKDDAVQVIKDLRAATKALYAATNALQKMLGINDDQIAKPATQATKVHVAIDPPQKQDAMTLEEVRTVLTEKSRDGHTDAIRALLEKHGASKLSEISLSHYQALLEDAEGLK